MGVVPEWKKTTGYLSANLGAVTGSFAPPSPTCNTGSIKGWV